MQPKKNNFNDINSKLNNECNGYIVFGTERPFIELFRDNRSRKHYMKKIIKSWIMDIETSEVQHVEPQYLLNKFLNTAWSKDKSFGAESSYQTNDFSNGRTYFLKDEFIHSYYFF